MGILFRDIKPQKQAEEELRQSRDKLEQRVEERTQELRASLEALSKERQRFYDLLETLPVMICLLTPDHRVPFANRAFRERFGKSQGRRCYEFCWNQTEPCSFCESHKPFETGRPHRWECRSPDGKTIISAFDVPFTDVDGSPMVLEMDLDITEQRQLEEQLRQTQKMEAIGTLAGGIAHDFNNMLAVILGNAELALDDLDDSDGPKTNIEQIVKASKRARDLIKQILTFSRKSEAGKNPIRLAPLVKETATLLRGTLPSTIKMDVKIKTEMDTILGDPVQIEQIILNLATNAAHAMRKRGGVLTFGVTNATVKQGNDLGLPPGAYVKLRVRDTGTGMTNEMMDRIFDPFFTTKGAGQGTGMGLAVVYGAVKNHNGTVTVESEPGKGSVFNIFLPYHYLEEQKQEEDKEEVPRGKERILLVDDEPDLVGAVSKMLERLGYHLKVAKSGSEAWQLFQKDQDAFDLVITDQTMPDLTGIDLARKILKTRKDMPIILFTGYSETVSAEKVTSIGISEFLMKPVIKREVAKTVRRVLDGKKQMT